MPALGYGIRYEFGIFQQEIVDGWQVEKTDKWLRYGNPWEIARPEWCCDVKFGGHTEVWYDEYGRKRTRWVPGRVVNGIPYDTPILGYRVNTANTLRLWKAEAPESFDFGTFNRGDYYGAVNKKVESENLTKFFIRTTSRRAARSCDSSSSTSSCRARSRTCCASAACRRFRRSASTRSSRCR
jgi:starch phosphorylase